MEPVGASDESRITDIIVVEHRAAPTSRNKARIVATIATTDACIATMLELRVKGKDVKLVPLAQRRELKLDTNSENRTAAAFLNSS